MKGASNRRRKSSPSALSGGASVARREIYLRAIDYLLEPGKNGRGDDESLACCDCIGLAVSDGKRCSVFNDPAMREFRELFRPDDAGLFWWASPPEEKEERLMALLFAAEIAKGDNP